MALDILRPYANLGFNNTKPFGTELIEALKMAIENIPHGYITMDAVEL